jgi:exonuclease VII small subunit
MGARRRSQNGSWGREAAGGSIRNIFKGGNELNSLARGIYEDAEPTYSQEEKRLFEVSSEVKNLIKTLEGKDDGKKQE